MSEYFDCDDELKIVNRKREYIVSKKFICSVVPYFEKMFCCDLLESMENKVELNFDEQVFNSIMDWIHSESFTIKVEYVINFYEVADYLMINDRLFEPCLSYFHENFTIRHLPSVLPQVTKVSKLISSGSIENIICRHFLSILNTEIFLDYPVETVEAILKLDLVVYSEFQIFESIVKWVAKKVTRRRFFMQLLNCVRWRFMDLNDLRRVVNHEFVKTLANYKSAITNTVEYEFDRSHQRFFISIHQKDDVTLQIKVLDNDFLCLTIGDFTQDDSISLEFVHDEHTSDILFDSGTRGVRINWHKKTYRWLDFKVAGKTYYSQLSKFVVMCPTQPSAFDCYLEYNDKKLDTPVYSDDCLLLESNGKFILIGKTQSYQSWFVLFPVRDPCYFRNYKDYRQSFRATVIDKVVYILKNDLEFIQFNIESKYLNKSKPFKDEKLDFNDLILTSHQTGDDKVFLINKSSGKIHVFCISKNEWSESYRVMDVNLVSDSSKIPVKKLITITSALLPMKNIKPLNKQCFYQAAHLPVPCENAIKE